MRWRQSFIFQMKFCHFSDPKPAGEPVLSLKPDDSVKLSSSTNQSASSFISGHSSLHILHTAATTVPEHTATCVSLQSPFRSFPIPHTHLVRTSSPQEAFSLPRTLSWSFSAFTERFAGSYHTAPS